MLLLAINPKIKSGQGTSFIGGPRWFRETPLRRDHRTLESPDCHGEAKGGGRTDEG